MADTGAHFLLVGDSTDLSALRGIVSRLPVDAYGQIFVEIAAARQAEPWVLPDGMTLSWLPRDRAAARLGGLAPRGELAERAVLAWVAEWIPEHPGDRTLPYILWIGCAASQRMDRLYQHLADRFENLHMHHPHHG